MGGPSGTRDPRRTLPPALLHVTGAVLVPLCLAAGAFELARARSGHELAWAYTVEWPLIAGYGVYVWVRLARERRSSGVPSREPVHVGAASVTPAAGPSPGAAGTAEADPQLAAWQAYLAELHAADPPGGPPARGRGDSAGRPRGS